MNRKFGFGNPVNKRGTSKTRLWISGGADKSLAFPICSTTKRIILGWVKEVRTMKS
jgi:hypothetical protein